jgi:hypothetical protein
MRSTCFHRIPQILGALLCSLLFAGPHPARAQGPGTQIQVSINPRQRFQMIDGFGVNFNGTYFRDAQKPMIDLLIDDRCCWATTGRAIASLKAGLAGRPRKLSP